MKSRQTQTALRKFNLMNHADTTSITLEKPKAFMAAYQFYIDNEEPLE